ncbi:MAG: endonuclease domain-containing protein [Hyphomonadaceae bacterium]
MRARALRAELTGAERALWRMLRARRFENAKFRRQHAIGPYVVDFACLAARLVIELDGPSHLIEEQAAFDARRTAFLQNAGWRVLRLRNADLFADESAIIAAISAALKV